MSHCPTLAPLGKGCGACTLPTPHWRAVPGPKVVYCSSVQSLPGGLSAGTGKLNCQTARSISLVDSDCSLNTSTERKRQVCVRHVQSKRQRRLPPPAAFPCRLKPTVPCGGNDGIGSPNCDLPRAGWRADHPPDRDRSSSDRACRHPLAG